MVGLLFDQIESLVLWVGSGKRHCREMIARRIQEPEARIQNQVFACGSVHYNESTERSDIKKLLSSGFWLLASEDVHFCSLIPFQGETNAGPSVSGSVDITRKKTGSTRS
jgi:hypothetical protein